MRRVLLILSSLATTSVLAFEQAHDAILDVPVRVVCDREDGWTVASRVTPSADGAVELEVTLTRPTAARPPEVRVCWTMPQRDLPYLWTTRSGRGPDIPPNWTRDPFRSSLASQAPVYAFYNDANRNRLALACDDAKRPVEFKPGLVEETCEVECQWRVLHDSAIPPSVRETVRFRFDARPVFWSDAVAAAADWVSATPGHEPFGVPSAAREPLYSSWYSFHQNVFDREIEAECAIAASLGMRTLIVDDGWQTDDSNRGYSFTGDWEISRRRFPDMAAHVKRVHALGMRYMVWFGVPMMGFKAKNYDRFKGKYLWDKTGRWAGYSCLDPRFPEVRDYICGLYDRAVREWDIDGLKLDFIDAIAGGPAAKPGDGRDIVGVPEAVDRLMTDVATRLKAVKPDILIEFRQSYIGPAIRHYGNMLRVADCPGDMETNRRGIAALRLVAGKTAVHSDMLEWHPTDSAENAARFVLNSIFGTVQYSMMLRNLPKDHLEMIRHWLSFTREHESALQRGSFRPHWPQLNCPLLVGQDAAERVVGVYQDGLVAEAAADVPVTYVLNATPAGRLLVRLPKAATVSCVDTFGRPAGGARDVAAGVQEIACPASGYAKVVLK